MAISNIWITEEYKEKVEEILSHKNVFELNDFIQKHQYKDANEQTEDNTQDHDVSIVDEVSFDVFIEHLDCYFTS